MFLMLQKEKKDVEENQKRNNNNLININTSDYGEFYNILLLEDNYSQSGNEEELYEEELIEDTYKNNDYVEEEETSDKYVLNNELELDIDHNLYLKI